MRIGPGSQVAKALLCKRSIRECKSRPGLQNWASVGMADKVDLKSTGYFTREGSTPSSPITF